MAIQVRSRAGDPWCLVTQSSRIVGSALRFDLVAHKKEMQLVAGSWNSHHWGTPKHLLLFQQERLFFFPSGLKDLHFLPKILFCAVIVQPSPIWSCAKESLASKVTLYFELQLCPKEGLNSNSLPQKTWSNFKSSAEGSVGWELISKKSGAVTSLYLKVFVYGIYKHAFILHKSLDWLVLPTECHGNLGVVVAISST